MRASLLIVAVVFLSHPAFVQAQKAPDALSADVVKAWTEAGAKVGWMELNRNSITFHDGVAVSPIH